MLDNIAMKETMVSYYTPETKRMSKQWTLKGKPSLLKAKVQASCSKQMVFASCDSHGLIYMHIAPGSARINGIYIHHGCPRQVLKELAAEEAKDDAPGVVLPLG
jgi:hypothetical protein